MIQPWKQISQGYRALGHTPAEEVQPTLDRDSIVTRCKEAILDQHIAAAVNVDAVTVAYQVQVDADPGHFEHPGQPQQAKALRRNGVRAAYHRPAA